MRHGGRYVVMSVFSYSGHRFQQLAACFAGWMMRKEPQSGETFEPSTVVDRVDIASDQRVCLPVILDLKQREMIWTDMALSSNPRWRNVEAAMTGGVPSSTRRPTAR